MTAAETSMAAHLEEVQATSFMEHLPGLMGRQLEFSQTLMEKVISDHAEARTMLKEHIRALERQLVVKDSAVHEADAKAEHERGRVQDLESQLEDLAQRHSKQQEESIRAYNEISESRRKLSVELNATQRESSRLQLEVAAHKQEVAQLKLAIVAAIQAVGAMEARAAADLARVAEEAEEAHKATMDAAAEGTQAAIERSQAAVAEATKKLEAKDAALSNALAEL